MIVRRNECDVAVVRFANAFLGLCSRLRRVIKGIKIALGHYMEVKAPPCLVEERSGFKCLM